MQSDKFRIVLFGNGYVIGHLARTLKHINPKADIFVTTRKPEKLTSTQDSEIKYFLFGNPLPDGTTHILSSVPPTEGKDPVLQAYGHMPAFRQVTWAGYLSTTGVYGDAKGLAVDETTLPAPLSKRAKARLACENAWLAATEGKVNIFRLSGIYGPGRNALERLKNGGITELPADTGPVNRIHVDDIVEGLLASMKSAENKEIYNFCDDCPAPTREVILYAGQLLEIGDKIGGLPTKTATQNGFMGDGHRAVKNGKMKNLIGKDLHFATYKDGLQHILENLEKSS